MSHYGPSGGNGPYGQEPEGPWPGQPYQGQPEQPYFGQPGSGGAFGGAPPAPGGTGFDGAREQDPFGRAPDQAGAPQPGGPFGGPFDQPGGQPPFGAHDGPQPPYEQGPPTPDGAPWGGPAQPEKKRRAPLLITLVIVLIAVLGGGGAGWYFLFGPGKSDTTAASDGASHQGGGKGDGATARSPAEGVKEGDCVVQKGENSVRPADCSDAKSFKVVARIDGSTDRSKCPEQKTNYIYAFDDHKHNSQDFVLCLATQDGGK